MRHLLFTVYDSKVGAYLAPFVMRTKAEAMRVFGDTANDPSSGFYKHPEDYTLFCIGGFDETTGNVVPIEAHEALAKAIDLINVPTTIDMFEKEAG